MNRSVFDDCDGDAVDVIVGVVVVVVDAVFVLDISFMNELD
jgi:hypothetical protein